MNGFMMVLVPPTTPPPGLNKPMPPELDSAKPSSRAEWRRPGGGNEVRRRTNEVERRGDWIRAEVGRAER